MRMVVRCVRKMCFVWFGALFRGVGLIYKELCGGLGDLRCIGRDGRVVKT